MGGPGEQEAGCLLRGRTGYKRVLCGVKGLINLDQPWCVTPWTPLGQRNSTTLSTIQGPALAPHLSSILAFSLALTGRYLQIK